MTTGCWKPTELSTSTEWANTAFGENVEWVVDDSVGGSTMPPLLDADRVYFERQAVVLGNVVRRSGALVALDRVTGERRWVGKVAAAQNAHIIGDNIGSVWGALIVFDRALGTERYQFLPSTSSLSSNVAGDGARFHVLTHDGRAVAIDAVTGVMSWQTKLAVGTATHGFGVTVSGDRVIATLKFFGQPGISIDSGIVASLDRSSGAVQWRVAFASSGAKSFAIVEPSLVVGSNVVIATEGHEIIALSVDTGVERWRFDAAFGAPHFASYGLTHCDGRMVAATGDRGLVALDPATGLKVWSVSDVHRNSLLGIHCSHGTVMAGSLRLFNSATGAPIATYPIDVPNTARGFGITAATRDENFIYAATTLGYVKFRAP